ncbi:MAG: hypothetical protein ACO276_02175 [Ilumatobacteraceae bacterium]
MTTERPIDIRDTDPDKYWETFAKKWTSLLTYRYLGRRWSSLDRPDFALRPWSGTARAPSSCSSTC